MFQEFFETAVSDRSMDIYRNIGTALLIAAAAAVIFTLVQRIFPVLYRAIRSRKGTVIRSVSIGSFRIISEDSAVGVLFTLVRAARFIVSAFIVYQTILLIIPFIPFFGEVDVQSIASGIVSALFVVILTVSLVRGMLSLHRYTAEHLSRWKQTRKEKVIGLQILSAQRIVDGLIAVNSLVRIVGFTSTVYIALTLIFNQFAFTSQWSAILWGYIVVPMEQMYLQVVNYLPNLFTIVFIVIVVRYLLKLIRFFFYEVEQGSITVPGFYAEWAEPTYQIARFLIFVFSAVVIFPYLPGSNSPFFQGISVFVGVLLSFGSTSAISNVVSGVVLTYMRPYKSGDMVKIGDTVGEVVEKSLLVTRVRTPKNVDVTIPNSSVLGSHILNYSARIQGPGLILHTTVTIGYDVPWETVHRLLIAAAVKSKGILPVPEPFVLQSGLNDYHVSYELNAFTASPVIMPELYSNLHTNIQNEFRSEGVEIMSPSFLALRDGNAVTIPDLFKPKDYESPGFRIEEKKVRPKRKR